MDRCPIHGVERTTGGCPMCGTITNIPGAAAVPFNPGPMLMTPAVDVPSIMFGNGYARGIDDERAAIVAWLRKRWPKTADAVSHGAHRAAAKEQASAATDETAKDK